MLEAIKFPAGIAHLDSGLANVHGDTFTHFEESLIWDSNKN
jgi:hypothetical protein